MPFLTAYPVLCLPSRLPEPDAPEGDAILLRHDAAVAQADDLRTLNPYRRRAAVEIAAENRGSISLTNFLCSADPADRENALVALLERETIAPDLLARCERMVRYDPDAGVRKLAAALLGERGAASSFLPLRRMLMSGDESNRTNAAQALVGYERTNLRREAVRALSDYLARAVQRGAGWSELTEGASALAQLLRPSELGRFHEQFPGRHTALLPNARITYADVSCTVLAYSPNAAAGTILRRMAASDDVFERWRAAQALGRRHDQPSERVLIQRTRDPDRAVRIVSTVALGKVADSPAAVRRLVELTTSPDGGERESGISALVRMRTAEADRALRQLLRVPQMREQIARALGDAHRTDFLPDLIRLSTSRSPAVRLAAVDSFTRLRVAEVTQPLVAATRDESALVRGRAAEVLPSGAPAIAELLDDREPTVARAAASRILLAPEDFTPEAAAKAHRTIVRLLRSPDRATQLSGLKAVDGLPVTQADELVVLSGAVRDLAKGPRVAAITALISIRRQLHRLHERGDRTFETSAELDRVDGALLPMLSTASPKVALPLIRALREFGDERAVDLLRPLARHWSAAVRRETAETIRAILDPEKRLKEHFAATQREGRVVQLFGELNTTPERGSEAFFRWLLTEEPSGAFRLDAGNHLNHWYRGSISHRRFLTECLKAREAGVREAGAHYLGLLEPNEMVLENLAKVGRGDLDPHVRIAAWMSAYTHARRFNREEMVRDAVSAIESGLKDPRQLVRMSAATGVNLGAIRELEGALCELLARETSETMRKVALDSLRRFAREEKIELGDLVQRGCATSLDPGVRAYGELVRRAQVLGIKGLLFHPSLLEPLVMARERFDRGEQLDGDGRALTLQIAARGDPSWATMGEVRRLARHNVRVLHFEYGNEKELTSIVQRLQGKIPAPDLIHLMGCSTAKATLLAEGERRGEYLSEESYLDLGDISAIRRSGLNSLIVPGATSVVVSGGDVGAGRGERDNLAYALRQAMPSAKEILTAVEPTAAMQYRFGRGNRFEGVSLGIPRGGVYRVDHRSRELASVMNDLTE